MTYLSATPEATSPVTACRPVVSVPVLSNSTAFTVRMRSKASRFFTRMPARAAMLVDTAIVRGSPARAHAGTR